MFYEKTYELVTNGNEKLIILKRNDASEVLVFKLPLEDYYEKLSEAHS